MSKSIFLRPVRLRAERFPLPELGEDATVFLRELPSKTLLDLQARHGTQASGFDFTADFLAAAMTDAEGRPLFDSAAECKEHLAVLPLASLDRLMLAALRVSGVEGRQAGEEKN